jgi:endonuclease I
MRIYINKISVFIFIWSLSFSVFAQIPAGYYDPADGLSGTTLQQALHNIIDGHTVRSYTQLWTDMQTTDKKANGKVWDMYSDIPGSTPPYEFTFVSDQCGTYAVEGDCYNREHSFPKSWFNDASPMYSDLFHLYPTDGKVNGIRSNYPFGETSSPTKTSLNGSKLGPCSYPGYTGVVFEPIDDYKGDFARTYFYMATRYYGEDSGWLGSDMVDGSQPKTWALNMLLEWHTNDPVSSKETDRNDDVYGIQGNRNPFIDHPEYVDCIWGSNCGTSPQISSIVTNPTNPAESETVNVSATITDDGTISTVTLEWGTDGSSFPNSITMTNSSGDTYTTSSAIEGKIAGTTVYYKITAIDNDSESTTSSTSNYTIPKSAPTIQAANITSTSKGGNFINLSWTNGNGDNRIVIINTSNSFTNPSNGDDPTANTTYSGSGEQIIYNGNSNSVSVTGLTSETQYWIRVYEFNNSGSDTKFITSTSTNNPIGITTLSEITAEDFTTCPATGWTTYDASGNKDWGCSISYMEVNAYAGDVASDDWLISPSLNLDGYSDEVLSFDTYTQYNDATYPKLVLKYSIDYAGSGDPSSATWNVLSFTASAENSSTWTNSGSIDLSGISGSSVYIAFQYTSTGTTAGTSSLWRVDNFSISGNTAASCTSPSTQASNISFSTITDNSMTVSWARGNGDNVLVVGRAGSSIDTDPSSGSSYTANLAFGSGNEIGSGNFVLYNGTGTSVNITTLSNSTTYHYAIYEYNNTDVCYNLNELTGNQNTNGTPVLSTTTATSITTTTASSGGNITSDGGSAVTVRGVCWSTSTNPTTTDSKTTDGTGTGSYTSSLTGLSGATTYYTRAYATNTYGTSYGDQISFSTLKSEPTNHVTSFATGTTSSLSIQLTWTDISSGVLPDAYLIKASTTSYVAITDPSDGTEEADATLVKNVNQGTGNVTFTGLTSSTTYYFKIYPYTNSGSNILFNTNATIPTANTTTDSEAASCITELFFSEYLEGSSNNKALEIYNGTGSSVDLTTYAVKLASNGGLWTTTESLSGTLADKATYVIANASSISAITSVADITSSVTFFNGDDAIGLFNNDVLIDVIGTYQNDPGTGWDVAGTTTATAEHTLVRKTSVTEGNTNWTNSAGTNTSDSEWEVYSIDETSYLGSHTNPCPCSAPALQTSTFTVNSISDDQLEVSWTRGNGDNVLVVAKSGSAVDSDPISGTSYSASAVFTSGDQIGTGNYAVYNGTGTSVIITGLSAGTTYYFALYEYYDTDVCYATDKLTGNETTYTLPTILTTDISSITKNGASSGGNVTDDGGPSVTSKGIVWGTSISPTIPSTSSTLDGTGTGVFASSLSGLSSNTTYYVRAYATNSAGTAYGNEVTFTTLKDEPTNHVTNFVTGTVSSSSIELSWTDASSGTLPKSYLIKMSTVALEDISDPTDGTAEEDGALILNISQGTGTCTFTGLTASTTYYFKIYPYTNSSTDIDYKTDGTIPNNFETTSASSGGTCPTELIISEYVEGSSNNKAIEIYNKTGSNVDLSTYSLKKQSGGIGAFGDELALSGTLADETTYVIVNSGAGATLLALADVTSSSVCLAFNGNDAVGLFKSGTMIDIVGVENQTTNWGAEQTLIRNSDVTSPVTTYNSSEWSSYSQDYFDNIGTHTISCGTSCEAPISQASNISFSNMANSSLTISWNSGNGDGVVIKMNTTNSFTDPVDATDPTANAVYSSGEQVVYNGSATTVDITGLSSNTQYFVRVYEKNCSGSNIKFLTTSPAEENIITTNAASGSEETLAFQGFEGTVADNWSSTIYPTTYNSSGDIWAEVSSLNSVTPSEGSIYWGMQDLNNGAGGGDFYHYINFDPIDISAYTSVTLTFDYYTFEYESTDFIEYEVVYDNGSSWNTFTPLNVNTNKVWTTITINVEDAENYIRLRIQAKQDGGSDYAGIDNIKLVGTSSPSYTSANTDYFRTCTDGAFNSTSTWQSSDDNSSWYISSLVPDQNASCITVSAYNDISHGADITLKELVLSSESSFAFNTENLTLTLQGDLTISSNASIDLSRTGTNLKMNGTALQTISGDGSISTYNLELDNANNLTLNKNLIIENQLTLTNGIINTGANILTIDNPTTSSISGHSTTNYINGNLKRAVNTTGSYDFPIGTASDYEYVNIVLNSSSGINYLTASFGSNSGTTPNLTFNGSTINSLLDAGIWTITPDAITTVNYDITVISRGHTNGAASADYHTLLKRNNSGTAWGIYGDYDVLDQSGSGTDPITLKRTGITSFSDFGGGPGDSPMPIELVFFEGIQIDNKIEISWQTASEINNDYFTLEKSLDATSFLILNIVDGAGSTTNLTDYESNDLSPQEGENYYRLKQTDFNGNSTYSDIISVLYNETGTTIYNIIFSPDKFLCIDFNNNISNKTSILIFDIMGRIIENKNIDLRNQNVFKYNLNNLETGIYNIIIQTDNKIQSSKIIVKE